MTTTTDRSGPYTDRELAAWRGLLETHAAVIRTLDAQMHAEHGLSLSAYEVLLFLADAPGRRMRMAELSDRVLLSRSGCTRLVDRLVELGYVTRCAAERDRRGLYAELTESGAATIKAAHKTHRLGVREQFLDHLSATDQQALADIWSRFRVEPTCPSP